MTDVRAKALEALKAVYAQPKPQQEEERGVGGDETVSEALSKEIFSQYVCRSVTRGVPHPGDIAEAASISHIQLPETSYPLFDSIPAPIVDTGKLSQLQLEGVLYACTKHQELLPSGHRAGFFIGDGAGVGKGRQIAGIILDNYARGRRRAVWLSTSTDLHHDATRDLRALGCHITVINNCQTLDKETRVSGLSKDMQEGVLFMTYSTLIGQGKASRTRLQQVVDWVGGHGFDGCLIFDECHKAKNFVPGKEAQSTKVAACVQHIQNELSKARVVYCSATGVSEVGNMAFMTRLGLWGPGSPFADFKAFLDSMKSRGVSFLEMLAMEMKSEGYYVARGLSFTNAEFMELKCELSPEQCTLYDTAVAIWQDLRGALVEAVELTGQSREVFKLFWSAQQRFFKLLCISMKVPTVVPEARKALEQGCTVVIGLQTTGEAAADSMGLEPGMSCGSVSTTKQMLWHFVATHFPLKRETQKNGKSSIKAADDAPEEGAIVPECLEAQKSLLQRIEALALPPNFLDTLIEKLGGPKAVAEMTGRKGRVVRDNKGHGMYELRAKPDSSEMDSLNVREAAAFMKGDKLVAIVSDAASTGISLHASAEAKNQRRRVHFTCELPWSADKAIQQLGRSHRSNQVSAPIYKLVMTNLGGEQRFAAAVARRLQSLGALTRGDRRAASGVDLSESNFDSPLGRKSLRKMYDCIVQGLGTLPTGVDLVEVLQEADEAEVNEVVASMPRKGDKMNAQDLVAAVQALHIMLQGCVELLGVGANMGRQDNIAEEGGRAVAVVAQGASVAKEMGDVRRFLNRLLGLPVARQNLFFNYFACTLAAEIRAAKAEGRYFEGVSDLGGSHVSKVEPQVMWVDPYRGLKTYRHDLTLDRGVSYQAACRKLEHEQSAGDRSSFMRSRHPMFGRLMTLLALKKPGPQNYYSLIRPNTGESYFDMEGDELAIKYKRVKPEDAEQGWNEVYKASLDSCMHGAYCQQGADCQVGKRLTKVSMLSGSIVRVWGALEAVLVRSEAILSKSDRTMRIVRVATGDANSLIGVRYPPQLLDDVVAVLASAQAAIPQLTPGGPAADVAAAGAAGGQLASSALQAAAMGAVMAVRTEPVTPVDLKSVARAFRAPKTVLDFFKPKAAAQGQDKKKRNSSEALHEIQVNGRSPVKRIKAEPEEEKDSVPQADSDCMEILPNSAAPRLAEGVSSHAAGNGRGAQHRQTKQQQAQDFNDIKSNIPQGQVDSNIKEEIDYPASTKAEPESAAFGAPADAASAYPATLLKQMSKGKKGHAGSIKEQVQALLAMGFTEVQAKKALQNCSHDVQRAANWLLAGT